MKHNRVTVTKVVSKDFLRDIWCRLQNLVGANLTSYEVMVQKGIDQIDEDLDEERIELDWFRYETTQLTNGAIVIMLYGEKKA